jgi:hypothetical protein
VFLKHNLLPKLIISLAISIWTTTGATINVSDNLQSEANVRTFQLFEGKHLVTTANFQMQDTEMVQYYIWDWLKLY